MSQQTFFNEKKPAKTQQLFSLPTMSDEEIDDLFGEETTEKIVDLSLPRHAVVLVMEKDVRLLKTPDF